MKTFLSHVASLLLERYGSDLSSVAVVFPNKRASLFLNEHLTRQAGRPIWSPAYITISDLFRSQSRLQVADPIKLVCDLHKSFTACTGIDETLDHFYGWGQLLLSDFDDVDKNMAPADKVFANLRDIHEFDDVSYLTDNQKEIIHKFFSNFSDDHNSELKQRFLQLWSHIGDIYRHFNDLLTSQGLIYEGALYRQVALQEELQLSHNQYVFVGFNLLHQAEQLLIKRLEHEGRGFYIGDTDEETDKHITIMSAPTENIQARYVSTWLQEGSRIADGRKTAIVLANEGLLQTVIHCLPEEVDKVNITTGYPLSQTPVASFVSQLVALQVNGYFPQTESYRLRYINTILRHPYMRYVSPLFQTLRDELNTQRIYYPTPTFLCRDEGLTLLFSRERLIDNGRLLRWLFELVRYVARNLSQTPQQSEFHQEACFRMYTLLNRLCDLVEQGDLTVDIITLQRLMTQLTNSTSIPFHGEPAEGIQVMGVLETRNIDFDHVLLLSCNEGNLPKGLNDTSFIPHSIRKAYGLTTVENKVAIYANYFRSLLQRASDVTIVYNNSTNDGKTGEMSRFMLQLMVESRHPIHYKTLQSGQLRAKVHPATIEKTPEVMNLLRKRFDLAMQPAEPGSNPKPLLTPTGINRYMRCPLRFFYYYACGLDETEDIEDDVIDNRLFGNIFHRAAEYIYKKLRLRDGTITLDRLEAALKDKVDIERAVDDAIKTELFQMKDPAKPVPPLDGLQLINREVIIKYLRMLLEIDSQLVPFTILGLERPVALPYEVCAGTPDAFTTVLGGTIDRLDCISNGNQGERIRVIDYKTGSHRLKALADVDAIFAQESLKDHSDYYLQAFLYSHIVSLSSKAVPVSPALLFIQHAGIDNYDPTLSLGKLPVTDIAAESQRYMQLLGEKITEIFTPSQPFTPTDDKNRCRTCPYANLCR